MPTFSSVTRYYATRVARGTIAGLLGFAILTGCEVGPNYSPPQEHMPATWVAPPTTRASITVQEPLQVEKWWTTFQDPELDSLVRRAVQSNLDVKLAAERIRAARATICIAGSTLLPFFNGNGAYTHSLNAANRTTLTLPSGKTRTFDAKAQDFWTGGFDASWEIDIFGGIRRGVEAATANYEATVEDRRDVLVSLLGELATDYVQLRGFQQQVKIGQENLTAQQRTLQATRENKDIGRGTGLDVANSEAEVAGTGASVANFQSLVQQQIYAISVLLGEEPATLLEELSTESQIPIAPPLVPVGLPSELLRRRPDIRRAERQLAAATANIGVAVSDLFPHLGLNGSVSVGGSRFSNLGNWDNRVLSIGPSFNWAIFDSGAIWSNIEVSNAAQAQALLTYRKTILTALQDVETSLTAYAQEQQRRALLADAVAANQRAVAFAIELWNAGTKDFLNVLVTQESLFGAQNALVQSNQAVATDLVAIYKALGGGWEVGEPSTTTQPARQ
jgi:NodT family efflux transporter outer membrane factor (OMF) lipoprotein